LASPADVQRFLAEAEAAANLQHPNIVAIHEVGRHEGHHYFSMDLVEGKNLAQIMAELRGGDGQSPHMEHGDQPSRPRFAEAWLRRAAGYVKTIALAIHYAHEQGTLHRDLKPSNIIVDDFDQPRITDFGLAKRFKQDSDLTASGQIIGTPNFMPPEQAAGQSRKAGTPGDIYSLGAILYFLITGQPPFCGENAHDTLQKVLNSDPVSPRTINPDASRDLEVICLKCLEKDPARRYSSARALADDLGHFLAGEPIAARPVGTGEKLWRMARRHRVVTTLLAALVLVPLIVAVVLTRQFHREVGIAGGTDASPPIHEMPTRSAQGVAGLISRKIYVTSPANGTSETLPRLVHVYDPKLNSWKRRADCLYCQADAAGGVISGKLYIAGGGNATNPACNVLEEYDPESDAWRFKAPMPSARHHCAGTVLDNKLYVLGGHDGTNWLATVESYDPATDTWSRCPDMLTTRSGCGAVVVDGAILVLGGATNALGACAGSVETWRPWGAWSVLPTDPGAAMPVCSAFTAVLNGLPYFFGGLNDGGVVNRSWCLARGGRVGRFLQPQQPMPEIRYAGSGTVVLDDRIWLFGGWTGLPNVPLPHPDVFVFDPRSNSWQKSAGNTSGP
jgi:hypothetical protein